MNRFDYYGELKEHARQVRLDHDLQGFDVKRSDLRKIYRSSGINHFDLWPPDGERTTFKKLRGAYFRDDNGCTIMVARGLPDEPAIFTMAHELKHHLCDPNIPIQCCDESNVNQAIEIGAEIFAAELIFPESEFIANLEPIKSGNAGPPWEWIIRLKHQTKTTLSYAALSKRAEFFGVAPAGSLTKLKGWRKLEESIYGEPAYKRLQRFRKARTTKL